MLELELEPPKVADPAAAVALAEGAVVLHAGLFYRSTDGYRVLHLADHLVVRDDGADAWHGCWARPTTVDELDLRAVSDQAAFVAAARPTVPYGLRYIDTKFGADGMLLRGQTECGLTCATFVLALFRLARVELLELSTWATRPEDVDAQKALVAFLEGRGASNDHVEAVRSEVGCLRYRPEEVAAATAVAPHPAAFADVAPAGTRVLEATRSLLRQ